MNRKIFKIAIPSIISNLTVPLLALTDTTISGHIGTLSLGAIAVAGTLFGILYNVFNFLRMGTGGFTAQAYGKQDFESSFHILVRGLASALLIGCSLLLVGVFFHQTLFLWMGATSEVTRIAEQYFQILIFGAPAVLGTYVFTGWFLGMQDARTPMWIAILQNIINIVASLYAVYGLQLSTNGLAIGTLIAQYMGIITFIAIWLKRYHYLSHKITFNYLLHHKGVSVFRVNRDIFFRTLCITIVQAYFTSLGAKMGNLTLAANALLMQFFIIQSYFMDGLAYAGESLGGNFYGANDRKSFFVLLRKLLVYGGIVMLLFALLFAFGGSSLLHILTNEQAVRLEAERYLPYAVLMPICGGLAFLLDGIFIGCTATHKMLLAMVIAALSFGICSWISVPLWENHGLWFSFLIFLLLRGIVEAFFIRKIAPKGKRL